MLQLRHRSSWLPFSADIDDLTVIKSKMLAQRKYAAPVLLVALLFFAAGTLLLVDVHHLKQLVLDKDAARVEDTIGLSIAADALQVCGGRAALIPLGEYYLCRALYLSDTCHKPCAALSYGVFDDPSADEFLGQRCVVDSYDPTIGRTTGPNPWSKSGGQFVNAGIGRRDGFNKLFQWKEVSIKSSVDHVLQGLGKSSGSTTPHKTVAALKMDIEGSEWDALEAALDKGVFDPPYAVQQVAMEVHIGASGGDMNHPDEKHSVNTWDVRKNRQIPAKTKVQRHLAILRRFLNKGYAVISLEAVGSVWNKHRYIEVESTRRPGEVLRVRSAYNIGLVSRKALADLQKAATGPTADIDVSQGCDSTWLSRLG